MMAEIGKDVEPRKRVKYNRNKNSGRKFNFHSVHSGHLQRLFERLSCSQIMVKQVVLFLIPSLAAIFFSTPFHFLFPFSFFFSMSAVKANHTGRFSRGRRRKIRKKEPNRIPTLLTFISPKRIFFLPPFRPSFQSSRQWIAEVLLFPFS